MQWNLMACSSDCYKCQPFVYLSPSSHLGITDNCQYSYWYEQRFCWNSRVISTIIERCQFLFLMPTRNRTMVSIITNALPYRQPLHFHALRDKRKMTHLPIVIPRMPVSNRAKLKRIYRISGRGYRNHCISISTANQQTTRLVFLSRLMIEDKIKNTNNKFPVPCSD